MKKYIILFVVIFCTTLINQTSAQHPGGGGGMGFRQNKEKVDAMKIGFLTDYLDLTTEEAKVFWPVYNKYQDEIDQLRKTRRKNLLNDQSNFDSLSTAELEKIVDSEIAFRQSELDIQKKYHPQFKKVLPMNKVAKLYRAEEEFKRKLLEMIRERKQQRNQNMNDDGK